jgi:hypothetical protein
MTVGKRFRRGKEPRFPERERPKLIAFFRIEICHLPRPVSLYDSIHGIEDATVFA